jgi:glucuronokinase
MQDFAGYAEEAAQLIKANRGDEIGPLLDKNFDRRRSLYKLDARNIEMIERVRSVGAHAKFAGSGGAAVGVYKDEAEYEALREVMRDARFEVFKPTIEEVH